MYTAQYDDRQFGPRARCRLDLRVAARGYAGIPSVDGVEFWTGGTADMMALTPVSLLGVRCAVRGRAVPVARYAEAFTVEEAVLDSGSDYSVN